MNIGFFVSDHGFGHMMRELPVIKCLLEDGHVITVICNSKHLKLAKDYLGEAPNYVEMHTDAGIVVFPGTIKKDVLATVENARTFMDSYPDKIRWAKQLFHDKKIDKIVVDIVPWAIKAAKEAEVSSYLMASFTWLDQYGEDLPKSYRNEFEKCFRMADHVLYYELCNKKTRALLGKGVEVGFVSREFHEDKIKRIRTEHSRKIVFLSLGASNAGIDYDIDVSELNYDFITTKALRLVGDNVTYLDIDTPNTQDYVKAADYCITKPGWTTVAEVMLAATPTALLERPDVLEDTMTIEMMKERNAAISIGVEELKDMQNVIDKMESFCFRIKRYDNSSRYIADIVSE